MQQQAEQAAQEEYSRDDLQEDDVVGMVSRNNQNNRLPLNMSSEEDEGYFLKVDGGSYANGHSKAGKTISQVGISQIGASQTSISQANISKQNQSQYIPQVLPNESFKPSSVGHAEFSRDSVTQIIEESPEKLESNRTPISNTNSDSNLQ